MKNKKGFAFMETVIILMVVTLSLALLLSTYSLISRKSKEKENYDKASDKYLLYSVLNLGTNARYNYKSMLDENYILGPKITPDNCSEYDVLRNIYNDSELSSSSETNCKKIYESMDIIALYLVKDINQALSSPQATEHFDNGTINYLKTLKKCNDEDNKYIKDGMVINTSEYVCDKPINYLVGVFYKNDEYYFASLVLGDEKLSKNNGIYTVKINYLYKEDKSVASDSYQIELKDIERYNVKSPTITGYTPDKEVVSGFINGGNMTINVEYEANKYDLTLNQQFESGETKKVTATYNKTLPNVSVPSRAGYTFNGYYTETLGKGEKYYDANGKSSIIWQQTSGKTLYASWTVHKYMVKYNGNGAVGGSTASTNHIYDIFEKLSNNGFERNGYIFQGWNSQADGTGENFAEGQTVKNLTTANNEVVNLYAIWKQKNVTCAELSSAVQCNTNKTDKMFNFTGSCEYSCLDNNKNIWRIKFKSDGDFTLGTDMSLDIFTVGGGGGGGTNCSAAPGFYCQDGGGGGGGYTKTYLKQDIKAGKYEIKIGAGGAVTGNGGISYFGSSSTYFSKGGYGSTSKTGGAGGSGGGSGSCSYCQGWDWSGCVNFGSEHGSGGRFGSNGSGCSSASGGAGQKYTTCEFGLGTNSGCYGVTEYSRGGIGSPVVANSGNGGDIGGVGSSGTVVIRNNLIYDIVINGNLIGTYTGSFDIINEDANNWKIKFLSSGELVLKTSLNVDLFLVGGGGGGGNTCTTTSAGTYCQSGGGGGGGYTKTYKNQTITAGTYKIEIGDGGFLGDNGKATYFGSTSTYYAAGGSGATNNGGNGGSGGGSGSCAVCQGTDWSGCVNFGSLNGSGGKFGGYGTGCSTSLGSASGGAGQNYTTCEFGLGTTFSCNTGITAYAQGGMGAPSIANSGNGGNVGGSGNSGILIIRNKR